MSNTDTLAGEYREKDRFLLKKTIRKALFLKKRLFKVFFFKKTCTIESFFVILQAESTNNLYIQLVYGCY